MADYFTKFSFRVDLPSKDAQAYALDLAVKAQHYVLDQDEPAPPDVPATLIDGLKELEYASWGFITEESSEGDAIWVHADDGASGEPEVACLFVQHPLRRFNPTGRVAFQWSSDCTRPRLDAYGGGAAVITAREIRTICTGQWVDEQHA